MSLPFLASRFKNTDGTVFGAIEVTDTEINCAAGSDHIEVTSCTIIPTSFQKVIDEIMVFFGEKRSRLRYITIVSDRNVDMIPGSPRFGWTVMNPHHEWQDFDLVSFIRTSICENIVLERASTAAAIGEGLFGICAGLHTFVYLHIDVTVSGGAVVMERPLRGAPTPDVSHMIINAFNHVPQPHPPPSVLGVPAPSVGAVLGLRPCRHHGHRCVQGLLDGTEVRLVEQLLETGAEHEVVQYAEILAGFAASLLFAYGAERVALGGGIVECPRLLSLIQRLIPAMIGDYMPVPDLPVPAGVPEPPGGAVERWFQPGILSRAAPLWGGLVLAAGSLEHPVVVKRLPPAPPPAASPAPVGPPPVPTSAPPAEAPPKRRRGRPPKRIDGPDTGPAPGHGGGRGRGRGRGRPRVERVESEPRAESAPTHIREGPTEPGPEAESEGEEAYSGYEAGPEDAVQE